MYLGRQFYCCPIPEVADGAGINCGWKDKCSSDQTMLTFSGRFLEDYTTLASLTGLRGAALSDALDQLDIDSEKQYCCGTEEAENWKDCYWAVRFSPLMVIRRAWLTWLYVAGNDRQGTLQLR